MAAPLGAASKSEGGGYSSGPMLEYAEEALGLQRKIHNDGMERTQPYFEVGTGGLGVLADMMGIDGVLGNQEKSDNFGMLLKSFGADDFEADPGYQFRLDEGQKAIERAAAARGQYYDPSTVKSLSNYNSSMADQTYNDAYNRYNMDQGNVFNRLAATTGIGQTANSQMQQSDQNYANQAGNIYGQMGNAITSANAAEAAQPSMFDNLLQMGATAAPFLMMASDIRLKENIEPVGEVKGIPWYHFNYKGDGTRYEGAMAQDVERIMPEAVTTREDGMKMVDYGLLGVEMKEVN